MDRCAWEQLDPWLALRRTLPVGAVFCVLRGPTRGRPGSRGGIRAQLHRTALAAGVRRRFTPQQFPQATRCRDVPRGVPLLVIQRQLAHADLGITSRHSTVSTATTRIPRPSRDPRSAYTTQRPCGAKTAPASRRFAAPGGTTRAEAQSVPPSEVPIFMTHVACNARLALVIQPVAAHAVATRRSTAASSGRNVDLREPPPEPCTPI